MVDKEPKKSLEKCCTILEINNNRLDEITIKVEQERDYYACTIVLIIYKSYSKLRTDNYLDNTFFESLNNNSNNSNYLSEIYHIYHRAGVSKVINHWLQNDCNTTPNELYFIIKKIKTDL